MTIFMAAIGPLRQVKNISLRCNFYSRRMQTLRFVALGRGSSNGTVTGREGQIKREPFYGDEKS
jgi:hypothetical protein